MGVRKFLYFSEKQYATIALYPSRKHTYDRHKMETEII
ncbi:hypothetical protein MNB_SV-6-185 [hydrothermal vent metagenome]|uniref:Uncharacterized protein n=1 Tax=hydrothermal vent metagenome TaxID=652676 RepID=A0A1W1BGI2_9ZZZZ